MVGLAPLAAEADVAPAVLNALALRERGAAAGDPLPLLPRDADAAQAMSYSRADAARVEAAARAALGARYAGAPEAVRELARATLDG
ncbi:hypothetical protein ACFQ7Z_30065 [Streptomyces virginiae]|uniref:hypothetical protein n=1 Tax=Streptomyces virginiae TaxID=1961 RepID=UPI0036947A35